MKNKDNFLEKLVNEIIKNNFGINNLLFLTKVNKGDEIKFMYQLLDNSKLGILQNSVENCYIYILLNIEKEKLLEINGNYKIFFGLHRKEGGAISCESIMKHNFIIQDPIGKGKIEDVNIKFKY